VTRRADYRSAARTRVDIGLRGRAAAAPLAAALITFALALLLALPVARGASVAAPTPTASSPVQVHAKAEPETVTIGTHFRYTVEVVAPPDVEVLLSQPTARISDFEIVDFGDSPPVKRDGKTVVTRWYTLVGYEVGDHLLKSPPVQYRRAGEALQPAPAAEIAVTVESLLAKAANATDIRDIKGLEPVPEDWRAYYFVGGTLAALLLLAALLYRILNRSRRARPAPPPKPAHVVAAEELQRLRRRGLVEQGNFKEYYSTLSAIVRTYIERRFGVRAPEMTTEEFLLSSARNGRLQGAHRVLLGEFLAESDLVKFARHVPTIADSERAYTAAQRFVDETAPGLMEARPPGTQEKLRAVG
jgi:hypothetical protein